MTVWTITTLGTWLFTMLFASTVFTYFFYHLSISLSSFLFSQVSGENMQVSASTMFGMFCMPDCSCLTSSFAGFDTASGSLGLPAVISSFLPHPDRPINRSNRKIIRYLSSSLFIRVFTAGCVWLIWWVYIIGTCWDCSQSSRYWHRSWSHTPWYR